MTATLLEHDGALVPGTVVERPNRFVLRVRFGDEPTDENAEQSDPAQPEPERVHLGDPGALRMLEPGRTVLCRPVDDESRKTDWDAIAVRVEDAECWAGLRPALANDLFVAALDGGYLTGFPVYESFDREPSLPDHGRADVKLSTADGPVYVEVKSCTHVEDGVAKFPDRQTERGRKHLRSLRDLVESGVDARLVFVVQRPDAAVLRPFREVDPEFADLLAEVRDAGVGVTAMSVAFEPPAYVLAAANLPVELV